MPDMHQGVKWQQLGGYMGSGEKLILSLGRLEVFWAKLTSADDELPFAVAVFGHRLKGRAKTLEEGKALAIRAVRSWMESDLEKIAVLETKS
ncbi:MAG: hypothetical protein ACRD22_08890 [Terriglobia bacterium]